MMKWLVIFLPVIIGFNSDFRLHYLALRELGLQSRNGDSESDVQIPLLIKDLKLSADHGSDLLKAAFSNDLDCRILARKNENQTEWVTLIGEIHCGHGNSKQLGSQLLKHYPLVGLEPPQLMESFFNERRLSAAAKALNHLISPPFLSSPSLLIGDYPVERTIYLEHNLKPSYSLAGRISTGCFMSVTLGVPTLYLLAKIGIKRLNLESLWISSVVILHAGQWMGLADLLLKTSKEGMRVRDCTMGTNIILGLEDLKNELQRAPPSETDDNNKTLSMAAVMGTGHLYGVRRFLIQNDFEDRTPELKELLKFYDATHCEAGDREGCDRHKKYRFKLPTRTVMWEIP